MIEIIRTKAELLAAKERSYDEFLAALAGMDDAQASSEPEPLGEDWNPKNVVAHVTYWETFLAKALPALLLEGVPFPGFDSYDRINTFSIVLRRTRPLTRMLAELETAHQDVTAIVQELVTDEIIEQRFSVAYASRVEQVTFIEVITPYIEHYLEHAAQIRAWRAA